MILDKIKGIKANLSEEDFEKFEKGEYKFVPTHKMQETGSLSKFSSDKEFENISSHQYYRLGNKLVEYNTHF